MGSMQNTTITHEPLTSYALGLEGEEDSLVEVLVIGEFAANRRGHPHGSRNKPKDSAGEKIDGADCYGQPWILINGKGKERFYSVLFAGAQFLPLRP